MIRPPVKPLFVSVFSLYAIKNKVKITIKIRMLLLSKMLLEGVANSMKQSMKSIVVIGIERLSDPFELVASAIVEAIAVKPENSSKCELL